jgi:ABC-2 type transport system ATP-binding protein
MIQAKNLTKYYGGDEPAIESLSFDLPEKEIIGLLGLNGAGKTTTIRILTGFLIPSSGDAFIDGQSIFENPIEAKRMIGYLPETPPLYEEFTVREYLEFVTELKSASPDQVRKVSEKTNLTQVIDKRISELSLGFRKRVGLAQAIVGDPKVVILDEPISGLDPMQIIDFRNLILSLKESHTILLSSHILSEIYKTCDRFLFLKKGKLIHTKTLSELEKAMVSKSSIEIGVSKQHRNKVSEVLSDWTKSGMITIQEDSSEIMNIHIKPKQDLNIKEEIQRRFFKESIFFEYMKSQDLSLEDVFMENVE